MPPKAPPSVDRTHALLYAIITITGYPQGTAGWEKVAKLLPTPTTERAARNQFLKVVEKAEMDLLLNPEALEAAKKAGHIPERKRLGPPKGVKMKPAGKKDEGKKGGVGVKREMNDIGEEDWQGGEGSADRGNSPKRVRLMTRKMSNVSLGDDEEPIEGGLPDSGSDRTYHPEQSMGNWKKVKKEGLNTSQPHSWALGDGE
jgi:hypothetical protein